jgi:hypothetical protein
MLRDNLGTMMNYAEYIASPLFGMPNARCQVRRTVGARDERTLFAVTCKPLFGTV